MEENAYITFYNSSPVHVRIGNGFSFVNHLTSGDNIFVELGKGYPEVLRLQQKLKYYHKIFCSFSFDEEMEFVTPIIDERWIIGGPLCCHADLGHLLCRKHLGCYERFIENDFAPTNQFNDYWLENNIFPKEKEFHYTCSLGQGCYWNKCRFCEYKYYEKIQYRRRDVEKIFSQLRGRETRCFDIVHTCYSALDARLMKETILAAKKHQLFKKHIILVLFARTDEEIIECIKEFDDLSGLLFSIGAEVFCQEALDILDKGIQVDDIFRLASELDKRKAIVCLSLMDNYAFLTEKMADECVENIKKLHALTPYRKTRNQGVFVYNNGPVSWPDENYVKTFSDELEVISQGNRNHWISTIKTGTEAFKANQKVSLAMEQNLRTIGVVFKTLTKEWTDKQRIHQVTKIVQGVF